MPARWPRPRPTTPCSSPTLGDHLAFYGDRSILNYRRIPTSGSRPARLSPGGSGAVSGADRRPSPGRRHAGLLRGRHRFPFWDSLALLQRHFTLTRVRRRAAALPGHRAGHARADDTLAPCPRLRPPE
ncbi:MAG: hypothetical protein R2854_21040 [Caldilineaceae bacterium]